MITMEKSDKADTNWNTRLCNSGFGTIYQSKEYGRVSKESNKPFLKFVNENGNIVAQLVLNGYSKFENRIGMKAQILKRMPRLKKNFFQWSYGPIIFDTNYSDSVYSALGNFLLSKNAIIPGWQHAMCTDGISGLRNKFYLRKWSTYIIDLSKNKDEIYQNISKHSGRKNIDRSIRRGVEIEEIDDDNLQEYAEFYHSNKNLGISKKTNIESIFVWWNRWKPLGLSGFLAKKNDVPISGMLFSFFNKHIIEGGITISDMDRKENLYSQDLIKWKIIEWGLENKMKYYNLAGFNPVPKTEKEEGILRYKQKWGGKKFDFWWILTKGNRISRNFG